MAAIEPSVQLLDLSIKGVRAVLTEGEAPLQSRLSWVASELERLAGEAYRLADEARDEPGAKPLDWPGLPCGRCHATSCVCNPHDH
jgi:hypothetical protein